MTNVFLTDFGATLGAFVVFALMLLGAGAAFARLLRFPGFEQAFGVERSGQALLCGLACLPVVLDLAGRFGPAAMAGAALVLTLAGTPVLLRDIGARVGRPQAGWIVAAILWFSLATALLVDWPEGSGLFHSLMSLDYVKHAEATWSVAQSGTPPWNPTFFTPGATSSYYYLFYTLTGVVDLVCGPLFGGGARHAAYAGASIASFALFALMFELWKRSDVDAAVGAADSPRSPPLWIGVLLLAAGLDILPVMRNYAVTGTISEFPEGWAEQVTPWIWTALWVPHHAAALVAAFVGFIALARPAEIDWRRTLLAALAFASTAGLSIYVGMAAALTAVLWLVALLTQRRGRDALNLALAGLGSTLIAAPWLLTLVGRPSEKAPLAFALRDYGLVDAATGFASGDLLIHLAVLLEAYLIQFGVFALGAVVYWRKAGRKGLNSDLGLLLVLATGASFLLGSFLRSTVLNNDLGWRVMLFAQAATLIWTLSALRAGALFERGRIAWAAALCLCLGFAYNLFLMHHARFGLRQTEAARQIDYDARTAWSWLDRRLPTGALVQAQPNVGRSLDFGLYGRFPSPVADGHVGQLFGATRSAVQARIAEMEPIFSAPGEPLAAVEAIAARRKLSAIVITASDPVFGDQQAWTAQTQPAFATQTVRVYLMPQADRARP